MRKEKLYNLCFLSDIVQMIKSSWVMECERVICRGAGNCM